MTQADPELLQMIAALAANFDREADEAMFQSYEMGLDDLPLADVKRAIIRSIKESTFMPRVAELRALAGVVPPVNRAVKAWEVFERTVVRLGYTASVNFDDPVINATVRALGGWERCCGLTVEEFDKWLRKDFERTYIALMSTGLSAEAAGPLLGFHDQSNACHGHIKQLTTPKLIACDLPPHRDGLVKIPVAGRRQLGSQKLLRDLSRGIGQSAEPVTGDSNHG